MYLQELWDITSYVCKKKRWNDCPRKKNTDVLKKTWQREASHRPWILQEGTGRTWKYLFWRFRDFEVFCLANIMSQSKSTSMLHEAKLNRFLTNNPPPKRFVLAGDYRRYTIIGGISLRSLRHQQMSVPGMKEAHRYLSTASNETPEQTKHLPGVRVPPS